MNAKRKAAPRTGAAARAEVDPEPKPKTIEFRELTLELPAAMPATMLFDITELEAASENPMPMFRLLRSVLGPEQFTAVRNKVTADDLALDVLDEVLSAVFDQYGISMGESDASPSS